MHFDDRLETVLRHPIRGESLARTQYRQLLDILGSLPEAVDDAQADSAYRRLDELSATIDAPTRADMLRQPTMRLRSPRLLLALAEGEPAVASAAIATARLSEGQWLALIPALPVRARGFLRNRRGMGPRVERLLGNLGIVDRGLPPAETSEQAPQELVDVLPEDGAHGELQRPAAKTSEDDGIRPGAGQPSDIATLVRRIEAFNRARRRHAPSDPRQVDAPRLPLGDLADQAITERTAPFDFLADREGRISWTDADVAPMMVGMRLAEAAADETPGGAATMATAMRDRQPLRGQRVSIRGAPAVSGDWQVDAAPSFDPALGGFSGYAGRFRRPPKPSEQEVGQATARSDRVREILHELRTPANAIQVAAEIIQQNLFGPTPHEYRAIAAMIASDTAYVLAGFDEVDRMAKLEGGAIEMQPGQADLAALVRRIVAQLGAYTAKRESGFALAETDAPIPAALDEDEAEQLVWRLLAVLAGEAAPSERLALACEAEDGNAVLTAELPASLAAREGDALFAAAPEADSIRRTLSAGMFGSGFSLRLARAETRAAGGSLKRDGNHLRLMLPGAVGHTSGPDQA